MNSANGHSCTCNNRTWLRSTKKSYENEFEDARLCAELLFVRAGSCRMMLDGSLDTLALIIASWSWSHISARGVRYSDRRLTNVVISVRFESKSGLNIHLKFIISVVAEIEKSSSYSLSQIGENFACAIHATRGFLSLFANDHTVRVARIIWAKVCRQFGRRIFHLFLWG